MTAAYALPPNETERLAALERLRIVGTPRNLEFDAVLSLALQITGCRAGVIGLMEGDRHWFKAEHGLDRADAPRHLSLCNHTLLQTEPLIVEDLRADPRFCNNHFVKTRGTHFYAGVALSIGGFKVGTLCVTDKDPRAATPELISTLRHLGHIVEGLLDAHIQMLKTKDIAETIAASEKRTWKKTRLLVQCQQLAKIGSWELETGTQTFFLSEEACRIHELESGSTITMDDLRSRMPPELRVTTAELYKKCIATGAGYEYRGEFVTVKGNRRWAHVIVEAEQHDGRVHRVFGTIRDITADYLAEQTLRNKSRLLEQSERMARMASWQRDVRTGAALLSAENYSMHEVEPSEALTMEIILERMPPETRAEATTLFNRCVQTGKGYEYRGAFYTAKGNKRHKHVVAEPEVENGKVVRVFGTVRDITAEYEVEQTLWRAAHYDALTQAPNRHYWSTTLDQAFTRAAANDSGLTILMFDLDGFKEINDTRGHAAGDAVLSNVAQRVAETLPFGAFYARLGGDEFAVLLDGSLTVLEVETVVRDILTAIQKPIVFDHMNLQVSGTFGAASFPADALTAADLMQKADIALYQAKRSHRSSFVMFRPEISGLFNDKRNAIDQVAAAIDTNRLVPFYQPKIDLKTGKPAGYEALCRIEASDGTILGPAQFLPALQDPASAARIGVAMLDLVTADMAAWAAEGLNPGRIAINVTGADFLDGALDRRVLGRLAHLGLPASAIEIEITENTILGKETRVVADALQAMREHGIIIALDDFGTGFASLTHLRDAPIDYIKLDRSFIAGLGKGADSAIIVKSIVDLSHSLGMRVVAEGIETDAQAEFLSAIGCDDAQGFLFGRPASQDATYLSLEQQAPARQALSLAMSAF